MMLHHIVCRHVKLDNRDLGVVSFEEAGRSGGAALTAFYSIYGGAGKSVLQRVREWDIIRGK